MTNGGNEAAGGRRRAVIHVSCTVHGGTPGFTNLVVTKLDGQIELNPHVDGSCVLRLDEQAAAELHETIGEMLGC